ncbi:MAG: hypothetical protein A3K19_07395 [Lentisphaerae bacterium RIFOXYB12_FULL_65_16]|nr:MAG: hypothetical protein A3K18_21600 [Lentisphaerae bacterium RIFOXYA12_64_32]OGV93365.1 MAG: hypothetical protein A3K19_07395 [Lentisphaerae bacterium RIFOXYB12_FULL_65_16]
MSTRNLAEPIAGWRLTEEPGLYGLVVRERGELIEYVSYREAARRQMQKRQAAPHPEASRPRENRSLAPV